MWNDIQQALNDSTTRLVTGIAALLPGLAALLVALAISGLIAWVAGLLLRRFYWLCSRLCSIHLKGITLDDSKDVS